MKTKNIVCTIITILLVILTATAMAEKSAMANVTIPVNGMSIYAMDPDQAVKSIRTESVKTQTSVAKYASNGYFTGKTASENILSVGFESHEVEVFAVEIVDFERLPIEVLQEMIRMNNAEITSEQFWAWLAQYTVSRITRIETVRNTVGTCLNAETYNKDIHGEKPVVRLVVGVKASEYWDIYERELNGTKIWTLVMKGKKSGSQQTQPQVTPTPAPVDVDPEPVWEDPTTPTPAPTEEPWDPGFNFDDDEDVDPAPVWEDPTPATPSPAPVQDWDSDFNFEDTTPAPQQDPAPVWEDPAPVVNTPAPAPQQPDPAPAPQQADPAPVWEEPAPAAAPQQQADPAPVWDDAPAATENQPQDDWDAGFNF